MKSTFKILFYLKRDKQKKNGAVPVYCRITIDGREARFGMKQDTDPKLWDVKTGRAAGRTQESAAINALLEQTRGALHKVYREIQEREYSVSAEKVKNVFLGIDGKQHTLLAAFDRHNEARRQLIGKTCALSTWQGYEKARKHLARFLSEEKNLPDIAFRDINHGFIEDFSTYLLSARSICQNSVSVYLKSFRHIISLALKNEWIYRDPFADIKIKRQKTDRGYLTQQEIATLMNLTLDKQLSKIRDVFVFCCFCGLSYIDVRNLTADGIRTSFDGKEWILGKREKTGNDYYIPLLDIPKKNIGKISRQSERRQVAAGFNQ